MTDRKTRPAPAAAVIATAKRRASIPARPVIQHSKLFRAELQVVLREKNDALANVDRALTTAASERDVAMEANRREYEAKDALAVQKFKVIRAELDAERDDVISTINGIEAALAATQSPGNSEVDAEHTNVVPLKSAAAE